MENEIYYNNTSIHLPLFEFFFVSFLLQYMRFLHLFNILHQKFCEEIKKTNILKYIHV